MFVSMPVAHHLNLCATKSSRLIAAGLIFGSILSAAAAPAQTSNLVVSEVDPATVQRLPDHHPAWANPNNDLGVVNPSQAIENLTLVLSRPQAREQQFRQLLADQQNPASPSYHQWLTPAEIGERFGPAQADIQAVTAWLQSRGLHVNWVAPSAVFVGFGGAAADIGRTFQTELHSYRVNGATRMSVSSDPTIPAVLAPLIKAIRGLYTTDEMPLHTARRMTLDSPQMNASGGDHFLAPADFATIYDLPGGATGAGVTIGIVARAHTDFADFANFQAKTHTSFANPTEVVPTAYGGVDPGPALTAPPTNPALARDQSEATLDVERAGSIAPGASLLLVVSGKETNGSDGIDADAQYLVHASSAKVISISFGDCESNHGSSGVSYWDSLFQVAAGAGISVFVSSGDSGASGCDAAFSAPPASPAANSPNYICSSSYATCVGGTEFNDLANPSQYWSSNNSANLASALGYIPEGAWNEPVDGNGNTQVASSGGGVSVYITPTPPWQTGTGVPSARSGRYTPDIAFSAAGHDGYFGCFAANGGDCVTQANGSYSLAVFAGTSAAAPSMAGITALLDQQTGKAQGSLNQRLYQMASATPTAFHDTTVATSGVSNCSVNAPSMCNNSVPGPGSTTQAGYLVNAGYDEVTGLGSLDVSAFLNNYASQAVAPTVKVSAPTSVTVAQSVNVSVTVTGNGTTTPTGAVVLTSGSYASSSISLSSGTASVTIPAGSLAVGNDTLTATYTPDSASSGTYTSATGTSSITVTQSSGPTAPTVQVSAPASVTSSQPVNVSVTVTGNGTTTPTGAMVLTSGSYTSSSTPLSSGTASITIPAGSLAVGNDTLAATYTPDSASSGTYTAATGTSSITVTAPSFTVTGTALTVSPGATTGNTSTITLTPSNGFTGTVALNASVTSSPTGASDPPTISFGSSNSVNITGTAAVTAVLTITTTAATNAMARPSRILPWYAGGGAALACILLLGLPARRRRWRTLLGMLCLLVALGTGMLACGGGGGGGGGGGNQGNPGTTAGNYTITITGTSGSTTETGTVTLTVN